MPNHTQNTLMIVVPMENREALLDDLKGPADWHAPNDGRDPFQRTLKGNGHTEIKIEHFLKNTPPEDLRKAYRADPINKNRPDWMPVSIHDIQAWARYTILGEELKENAYQETFFSVAKLAPWPNEETFHTLFPGVIDENGWWEVDKNKIDLYNSGQKGYIALRHLLLGVKWPPYDLELVDDGAPVGNGNDKDTTTITIRYTTPWAPIQDPTSLLWNVLKKHKAKALIGWEEEDSNSGYFYMNPDLDINTDETYDHGRFSTEVEDENDPEDTWWEWDTEAFWDQVSADIDDNDF